MNAQNKRIEKLRNIVLLFNEYQSVFAGVAHDSERIATFNQTVNEIIDLNNKLEIPQSIFINQRSAYNARIKRDIKSSIVRAASMAKKLNDVTIENTFAYFITQMRKKPSASLASRAAAVLLDYVGKHAQEAISVGFTQERLVVLNQLAEDTEAIRVLTKEHSDLRKVDQHRLNTLLSEASMMLRDEFDWLMQDYTETNAVMCERYRMLRQRKKGIPKPETYTDVSGTVTDKNTGEPVHNAKIVLVNVSGMDAVSDADGYYLLDEIDPGSYQLSCVAPGYLPGTEVAFTIREGESLAVDFALVPQAVAA